MTLIHEMPEGVKRNAGRRPEIIIKGADKQKSLVRLPLKFTRTACLQP